MEVIRLKTQDGKYIYGNCWKVEKGEAKANVVIAHGMTEYSARYDEFARFLNTKGYDVYAVDQPGHGLNVTAVKNPELGLGVWPNSGFKLAIEYLSSLITEVRLTMKPVILIGHSMGSIVSQRYFQRFSNTIDGLVLVGSTSNQFDFVFARGLSKIMNKFMKKENKEKPSKFFYNLQLKTFNRGIKPFPDGYNSPSKFLSYNEENVKKYDTDPLCGFVPSFNFYFNLFGGMKPTFQLKRVKQIENKFDILIVAGKDDTFSKKGKKILALEKFYKKGGVEATAILYEHARHEVLNEDEAVKNLIFNDIAKYCDHRTEVSLEKQNKKKYNISSEVFN